MNENIFLRKGRIAKIASRVLFIASTSASLPIPSIRKHLSTKAGAFVVYTRFINANLKMACEQSPLIMKYLRIIKRFVCLFGAVLDKTRATVESYAPNLHNFKNVPQNVLSGKNSRQMISGISTTSIFSFTFY